MALFGKPAWEIEGLEEEVNFRVLDEVNKVGKDLQERLHSAAQLRRELLNRGWEGHGALYDLHFYKDVPIGAAKQELKEIGLNPDGLDPEEMKLEDESDERPTKH